jgi:thymidine kinase
MRGGWIHVIAGCMFSGKTAELVRLLIRAEIAGRRVVLVRPALDSREPGSKVKSRAGVHFRAKVVDGAAGIPAAVTAAKASVVGIEEAEFFGPDLPGIVEALAAEGRDVIVSGLDTDFLGRPFGSMPVLLAIADQVSKLTAICVVCGEEATRSQRLHKGRPASPNDPLLLMGGIQDDLYEARCRAHHIIPGASPRD